MHKLHLAPTIIMFTLPITLLQRGRKAVLPMIIV